MKTHNHQWTEAQEQFLRLNYGTMSAKRLAQLLYVKVSQVNNRIQYLKLRKK